MENPTFRLEGVIHSSDEMEDFEGPLTLILQLLAKNKIEIQDIRISDILDQYMAWLDEMKAMDLEVASEFVSMASHLVYIKARMLLNADEEPSELVELIKSLERLQRRGEYDRIKAVVSFLEPMYQKGAGTMTKPPEYIPEDKVYRYVHDRQDLMNAMLSVLTREDGAAPAPEGPRFAMPARIIYPVTDKSEEIMIILTRQGQLQLRQLYDSAKSRTELVATFIALLELCKAGKVALMGEDDDMTLSALADTDTEEVNGDGASGA